MDPKTTAKSKRNHTQHNRRAHPTAAAAAATHKNKSAATAAAGGLKRRSQPSLPSNWDRYDDNADDTNESAAGEAAPKSKGADFGFLIEQARSQPRDFVGYEDDASIDFLQGMSSMLSVRGKSLLSICRDDNFIVDNDPTPCFEVPFLSMDLNALSAQLSKLKLSQRLFMESDLLPEELIMEESKTTPVSKESQVSEPADHGFDSQSSITLPIIEINTKQIHNDSELEASKDSKQVELSSERQFAEQISQISDHTGPKPEQKLPTSRFEASEAEEELDVLLDSFSQTSLSGSIADNQFNKSSSLNSSSYVAKTSIDDSIDELLAETSLWANDMKKAASQQNPLSGFSKTSDPIYSTDINITSIDDSIDDLLALPLKQGASSSISFPRNSRLGSTLTNAYDTSGSRTMMNAIDDSIDELLAETSLSFKEQKKRTAVQGNVLASTGLSVHTSSMGSKATDDDIDSWLNSL